MRHTRPTGAVRRPRRSPGVDRHRPPAPVAADPPLDQRPRRIAVLLRLRPRRPCVLLDRPCKDGTPGDGAPRPALAGPPPPPASPSSHDATSHHDLRLEY